MYRIISIIIVLFLSTVPLYAQDGVSLGLGGAYTALARETEAIYWNPANLALYDTINPRINIKPYSFYGGFDNNALTIDLYNKYNGKYLTATDKKEILDAIPDNGFKLLGKVDASALGISYRNFGFSIEANGAMKGSLSKNVFDIILNGNIRTDSVYNFSSSGYGFGLARFNFSYGRVIAKNRFLLLPFGRSIKLRQVNAGATLSILRGIGYVNLIDSNARLELFNGGFNAPSRFRVRESRGGWGVGLDLGFSMVTETQWCAGFALDNALSTIRWSKEAKERTEQFDLRQLRFLDELSDLKMDDYRTSTDKTIRGFSDDLPRDFRLGIGKYFSQFIVSGEWARENGHMLFTAGGGVYLSFLHLYAGFGTMESDVNFSGAIAFDFRYVIIDFGFRNRSGFTSAKTKGLTIAHSIRLAF